MKTQDQRKPLDKLTARAGYRKRYKVSKYRYILDAGHGGVNPATGNYVTKGKRSPIWEDGTQYFEGVGNRDIVQRISIGLDNLGIDYGYTLEPTNWRDQGLGYRCELANKQHDVKPSILFSIHSNGASSKSAHGYEVFTSPGETASDKFATVLFEEYGKEFPTLRARKDGDPDKEDHFYILKHTRCPAILLESMFHTNEGECKDLMNPLVRQRIADAVIKTIVRIENEA